MTDYIDRYTGIGGTYVVVNGERFPADENYQPLPHNRPPLDESAPEVASDEQPIEDAPASPQE